MPELGEVLDVVKEYANIHDRFAVTIIHNDLGVVGHVHMKISKLCSAFFSRNGTILASFTGGHVC